VTFREPHSLVSEPDQREEEGSGHMPTFEMSPRSAMRGCDSVRVICHGNFGPANQNSRNNGPPGPFSPEKFGPDLE